MSAVSIPDDTKTRSLPAASGKIAPPGHIAWSHPFDCAPPTRAVMTEGLEDDVRYYIDRDTLLEIWDGMWLSPLASRDLIAWTTCSPTCKARGRSSKPLPAMAE